MPYDGVNVGRWWHMQKRIYAGKRCDYLHDDWQVRLLEALASKYGILRFWELSYGIRVVKAWYE